MKKPNRIKQFILRLIRRLKPEVSFKDLYTAVTNIAVSGGATGPICVKVDYWDHKDSTKIEFQASIFMVRGGHNLIQFNAANQESLLHKIRTHFVGYALEKDKVSDIDIAA